MGMAVDPAGNGYPAHELSVDTHPELTIHRQQAERKADRELAESTRPQALDITARQLEKVSLAFNKKLRFEVNKDLDQVVVKVIDPNTDKVIKELPPEELQRLQMRIREMIGLLFDEWV